MQLLSYKLVRGASRYMDVEAITWGGSQMALPGFAAFAFVKTLWLARRRVDVIHIGDPVLSPLGWVLGKLLRTPVVVTAHGLDVTFPQAIYQRIVPRYFLPRLQHIVCISESTRAACLQRDIPSDLCTVIHPGVDGFDQTPPEYAVKSWVNGRLGIDVASVPVMLTVGRLVPRKGVAWLVQNVLPGLARTQDLAYVVVGDGPDMPKVRQLVDCLHLNGIVHLLGQICDDDLQLAYAAADLFVMPNLRLSGDMEGFGLVALEAAAHGVPVWASDLEGLSEAVLAGRTGQLLTPGDPKLWTTELGLALADRASLRRLGDEARVIALEDLSWDRMVRLYAGLFEQVVRTC